MTIGIASIGSLALPAQPLSGQVLARPGWAGAGVTAEPWWHSAVIYRLDPARFQDSGGTGLGDLAGVARRLEYLQSLGVDAILLDKAYASPAPAGSQNDLDELIRAASQHRLRVLLAITPAMQREDRQTLLARVRQWLSAGAAGVALLGPGALNAASASAPDAGLVAEVSRSIQSFPGGRVLLADPAAGANGATFLAARRSHGAAPAFSNMQGGQLVTAGTLPVQASDAAELRQSLAALTGSGATAGAVPLLRFAGNPRTGSPDAAAAAALLLASGGAALFDFGDEIGLDAYTETPSGVVPATPGRAGSGTLPIMQWTPANIGQPAPAPIERVAPIQRAVPGSPNSEYGAYHPYVRPSPQPGSPANATSHAPAGGEPPATLPDPDTLPGFTTGILPAPPMEGKRINVATEDRDPGSLLNAYRQLIALHHGNITLRDGGEFVLNRDAQRAVVWVRRASAESRAATEVIGAVNLGDVPVTLALDGDLVKLRVRTGALRPLFASASQPLTGETTGTLRLPPHAVFLGETLPQATRGSRRSPGH